MTYIILTMHHVLSQFLRERRRAVGKTQVQVAEEVFEDGRRQSHISDLERGAALPDLPTLMKLRKSLDFSLSDIEDAVCSKTNDSPEDSAS